MQIIRTLTDDMLLEQIRHDARTEREAGLAVIHKLREIRARRLDARLGYSSLYRFCTEELGYSSGSAWRRIKSMEALEELPELEARIAKGELSLASVSQVQAFCDQQAKPIETKREILARVSGLSKRETEKVLASIAPLPERPEKVRAITAEKSELTITLDAETVAALDRIRGWISHTVGARSGGGYAEVIKRLAQMGVERMDPGAPKRSYLAPPGEGDKDEADAIPAANRREVWRRDGGICGYVGRTGRKCGATEYVQCDHILPRALGGTHEVSNLRLRCGAHNRLHAVEALGAEVMAEFV